MVISSFVKFFISKFSEKLWKKNKKTSYLENYQKLSSHIQRQALQLLRVPSQCPTTELRSSTFCNFLKFKFLKIFWKNHKKCHISKTTRIWAAIFRGKIRNPLRVPSQFPITGLISSKFWNFLTFRFFEIFGENHKKRHISKATRIWAVILGGEIRNFLEYSDRFSLHNENFKFC